MTKEGLTFSQSTLEVSSVEDMDESNYTCIAVNEFGNDSAVFDLSLDSEGKLKVCSTELVRPLQCLQPVIIVKEPTCIPKYIIVMEL